MSVVCVPVRATLSARGGDGLTPAMWSHIEACASCQTELADDELIRSDLRELAHVTIQAPADIVPRVMDSIGPWAVSDPAPAGPSPTVKVIAAAAVATAATAAASTVVIFHRHRSRAA